MYGWLPGKSGSELRSTGDEEQALNYLASNLRRLRKQSGLSQQELADAAKLPCTTLADMEREDVDPGLESVVSVAVALNVGLDELVSPPPEHRYLKVAPEQVKEIRSDSGRFVARLLSPISSRGVQIQQLRLDPGCRVNGRTYPLGSQVFLFTYDGSVDLEIDSEEVTVECGALVQFPGHLAHSYRNPEGQGRALAFESVVLS